MLFLLVLLSTTYCCYCYIIFGSFHQFNNTVHASSIIDTLFYMYQVPIRNSFCPVVLCVLNTVLITVDTAIRLHFFAIWFKYDIVFHIRGGMIWFVTGHEFNWLLRIFHARIVYYVQLCYVGIYLILIMYTCFSQTGVDISKQVIKVTICTNKRYVSL